VDATLSNSDGSTLALRQDYGSGFDFSYNLTAGQTYYLDLLAYMGTGTYTVNIKAPPTVGSNTDTVAWALNQATANSNNGVINNAKQTDRYQFSAPVSGTYTFFTSNKAATLTFLDATLNNSSGGLVASRRDYGSGFSFTCNLTAGQTYYLVLVGHTGTGAYTINISVQAN
jgi:hypothetical protein